MKPGEVSFKLPKKLKQQAHDWHVIMQSFVDRHFDRIPQLLRMPSGRRVKWTKQGESEKYDIPNIFVRGIENEEKKVMRDIRYYLMEIDYEEAKRRFDASIQS